MGDGRRKANSGLWFDLLVSPISRQAFCREHTSPHFVLKPQTRRSTRRKSNGILGADAG